jgi:hypothetical protein
MLNVIMLNVVMPSVIVLSVIVLSVVMLSAVMLTVVAPFQQLFAFSNKLDRDSSKLGKGLLSVLPRFNDTEVRQCYRYRYRYR